MFPLLNPKDSMMKRRHLPRTGASTTILNGLNNLSGIIQPASATASPQQILPNAQPPPNTNQVIQSGNPLVSLRSTVSNIVSSTGMSSEQVTNPTQRMSTGTLNPSQQEVLSNVQLPANRNQTTLSDISVEPLRPTVSNVVPSTGMNSGQEANPIQQIFPNAQSSVNTYHKRGSASSSTTSKSDPSNGVPAILDSQAKLTSPGEARVNSSSTNSSISTEDLRYEVKAILESIALLQAQTQAAPLCQEICACLYQPGHPDREYSQLLAERTGALSDFKYPVKNIQTWLNQFTQPIALETSLPDKILCWQDTDLLLEASLEVASKAALFQDNGDFILQCHPQNGELKPADDCLPADRRHVVLPLPRDRPIAYAKFFPDAPGNEIAVSHLHDLLIGHGAPMASLARFLPGTLQQVHPYPVLFSEAVTGPTLEEVLTNNQPLNLEPEHYSDMVLMAMLIIPLDGKPANYIVETIGGTNLHRLVSVDNALSFGLPVTKQVTTDGYQFNLQLISILFCFDEMRQIVHPNSRKRWLAFDSYVLLQTWLNRLVAYNQHCFVEGKLFPARACQHWHDRDPERSALLPFLLLPETITDVYRRFEQLQSFLDRSPDCTHEDLLDAILPHVKIFYAPCWEQIMLPVRNRFIQLAKQYRCIEIHHLSSSVALAAEEAKEDPEKPLLISSRRPRLHYLKNQRTG
ncbi:unnamed protein product [Adineta steineri]|uniref:Uncharacterized protein n=1 Tax=Adineta steineri TaxID=433720 RepID=A0A813V2R9_9BILA|nr:unnamed protein product [Adineta steineri]CAF3837086.1 unnamed protein product [Adineta steineri]